MRQSGSEALVIHTLYQSHLANSLHANAQARRAHATTTLELHQVLGNSPAIADLANGIYLRHANVREEHFVLNVFATQRNDWPHLDSWCPHVNQQKRDAELRYILSRRAHQTKNPICDMGMRRPDFVSITDELIAVVARAHLQRSEVRAGTGLRIALAPEIFARKHPRQIVNLLFARAMADQNRSAHADSHR